MMAARPVVEQEWLPVVVPIVTQAPQSNLLWAETRVASQALFARSLLRRQWLT